MSSFLNILCFVALGLCAVVYLSVAIWDYRVKRRQLAAQAVDPEAKSGEQQQ